MRPAKQVSAAGGQGVVPLFSSLFAKVLDAAPGAPQELCGLARQSAVCTMGAFAHG
jgi:hypothetical protein